MFTPSWQLHAKPLERCHAADVAQRRVGRRVAEAQPQCVTAPKRVGPSSGNATSKVSICRAVPMSQ
jgi:hypothetical protein